MSIKRAFYFILGCIGLAFGVIGAIVPMLPAFPFLVLAAFGFSRSSESLHRWFLDTNLYKDNLESFLKGKGMTKGAKLRIILTVTVTMTIGFLMLREIWIGQVILSVIWVGHLIYFLFGVKTRPNDEMIPDQPIEEIDS